MLKDFAGEHPGASVMMIVKLLAGSSFSDLEDSNGTLSTWLSYLSASKEVH